MAVSSRGPRVGRLLGRERELSRLRRAIDDALWAERLQNPWIGAVVAPAALGWVVAVAAAAVAYARAGAPRPAVVALALAAVLFGIDHTPPFAPLAMVALLVAAALLERRPACAPAEAEVPPAGGRYHPRTG